MSKVDVLEYWQGVSVASASSSFDLPAVMCVKGYVQKPKKRNKTVISRRNIFVRDQYMCQCVALHQQCYHLCKKLACLRTSSTWCAWHGRGSLSMNGTGTPTQRQCSPSNSRKVMLQCLYVQQISNVDKRCEYVSPLAWRTVRWHTESCQSRAKVISNDGCMSSMSIIEVHCLRCRAAVFLQVLSFQGALDYRPRGPGK